MSAFDEGTDEAAFVLLPLELVPLFELEPLFELVPLFAGSSAVVASGSAEGSAEGSTDGSAEGSTEGSAEGSTDGSAEGSPAVLDEFAAAAFAASTFADAYYGGYRNSNNAKQCSHALNNCLFHCHLLQFFFK